MGSPQIRNRGTVGGNLGTASPAGDGLPPLYVSDAEVELASATGTRRLPVADFVTGPKRQAARDDELIAAFHLPAATGAQQFAKIGTRNAMVIAVCSLSLAIWPERRAVCACIGSAGPTPIRAGEAEAFIAGVLDEEGLWEGRGPLADAALERFGALVAAAAAPIDDVRGSAAYRRHALGVLGAAHADVGVGGAAVRLTLTVNGELREADGVWEGESLLMALRDHLDLPGSKNACEQGECGSCSVYLDGELVCACLVLAGQAEGREVVTVEGLADGRGAARRPAGLRRGGRGAVRLLHAGADRRQPRPAVAQRVSDRCRDPRGAGRQPVPLHGLREDPRRGRGWRPGALA